MRIMPLLLAAPLLVFIAVGGCNCGEPPGTDGGPADSGEEPPPRDAGQPCPEGEEDCPCASAPDECDVDLACEDDVCVPCAFGSDGCPCDQGACTGAFVCDDQTETCRAIVGCSGAGCALHQLCDAPSGADATCLPDCDDGYDYVASSSSCVGTPSCTSTDPGFLSCAPQNRVCTTSGAGADGGTVGDGGTGADGGAGSGPAVCGGCVAGYRDVSGTCVLDNCANSECVATGHQCTDGSSGPTCLTGCLDTWVTDNLTGNCIDKITCAELTCTNGDVCIPATTALDAQCQPPSNCTTGFAADPITGACFACSQCYDGTTPKAHVTGIGNNGFFSGSTCICQLEAGYFQDVVSGDVQACDADGDGWMRDPLEGVLALQPTNPLRAEEKCPERAIGSFVLSSDDWVPLNEDGTKPTREIALDDLIDTYDLDESPFTVDVDGKRVAYLIEPRRLDDQADMAGRWLVNDQAPLKRYGAVATPGEGQLFASEVNPLTKWCNDQTDDLNFDGAADVVQTQEFVMHTFPQTALRNAPLWYRMAYFVELSRGYYVAPDSCGSSLICPGKYVIQERDRDFPVGAGDDPPWPFAMNLTYGGTDKPYWRQCLRSRDPDYAGATDSPVQANMDFARWYESCQTSVGSCVTSQSYVGWDGRDPMESSGVDITDLSPEPGPDGLRFPGMGHSSQFKCVNLRTTNPADANRDEPDGTPWVSGDDGEYAINLCTLPASRTDSHDLPADVGSSVNPASPQMTCTVTTDKQTLEDSATYQTQNFWVALREPEFNALSPAQYAGGCIDENVEWSFLCTDNAIGNSRSAFGELFCGCDAYRGGADCSTSCAAGHRLSNRIGNEGAITGYWMCIEPALSSAAPLTDGTYTLRGAVPLEQQPIDPLCEVVGCATGLKLSAPGM